MRLRDNDGLDDDDSEDDQFIGRDRDDDKDVQQRLKKQAQ